MITLIFFLIIGLLIFVHEFGHFIAAKRAGAKVEEFGFGFPPRLFGLKRGETIYSINLFPIGGFVKIYGEEGQDKENPRSFAAKSVWQRAKIVLAGVTMNLILAVILLTLGFTLGLPTVIEDSQEADVSITYVAPNSPAKSAGIMIGDKVIQFSILQTNQSGGNYQFPINNANQLQKLINEHKGEEVRLSIQRGKEIFETSLVPRENPPAGEGPIGVALANVAVVSYPFHQAFIKALTTTFNLLVTICLAFAALIWNIFSQGKVAADLAGPVGIFMLTSQAAKLGFIYLLQMTVLLSVNLAVINILPFPALDGGRLLFLVIEKIKGSPLNHKIEKTVNMLGFIFLILLMIMITLRDVKSFF